MDFDAWLADIEPQMNDFDPCYVLAEQAWDESKNHLWISVEDRLPPHGAVIDIMRTEFGVPVRMNNAEYLNGSFFDNFIGVSLQGVTHWMPIPLL